MSDISNSTWEARDDANIHPSPDGIAKDRPPNEAPEVMRAMRGAIRRWYELANALYVTTGTATAFVLTPTQSPETYVKGATISFFPHATNSVGATINIGGLGAKSIVRADGSTLLTGDIAAGQVTQIAYDGTNFRVVIGAGKKYTGNVTSDYFIGDGQNLSNLNASNLLTGTISDSRLPGTMSQKTFIGPLVAQANAYVDSVGDKNVYFRRVSDSMTALQVISSPTGNTNTTYLRTFNWDGSAYRDLLMKQDGTLNWGTTRVMTSAGGTVDGALALNNTLNVNGTTQFNGNIGVGGVVPANAFANGKAIALGDNDSGIRGNADGQISLWTNNTQKVAIDTNATFDLPIYANNSINARDNVYVNSPSGNPNLWLQRNGTSRGVLYHAGGGVSLNTYNTSSAVTGTWNFQENGNTSFPGSVYLNSGQEIGVGAGRFFTDGNIQGTAWANSTGTSYLTNYLNTRFAQKVNMGGGSAQGNNTVYIGWGNDGTQIRLQVDASDFGNQWPMSISKSAGSLRNGGTSTGQVMVYNWSGQGGQPQWLWGGNDVSNMYVYNPSNFSVNYANSAGNSNALGGVGLGGIAQFSNSGNQGEINFPNGQILACYANGAVSGRRELKAVYLHTNVSFYSLGNGATTQLPGAWRQIGGAGGDWHLYQRIS